MLSLLPTQRSFEEIAVDLAIAHSTVKTHVRAIYSKLGVSSRRDAVTAAWRRGIVPTDAGVPGPAPDQPTRRAARGPGSARARRA